MRKCMFRRGGPTSLLVLALVSLVAGLDPARLSAASTITYVQGNYATPQTPQTSVTVSFTAAQTAGDLNVVVVGWNDTTATVSTVTDKSGNAYALAIGPTIRSGALSQSIYYAKNIAPAAAGANTVTVTFSTAAAYPDIRILEYSGADPSNPVDVTVGSSGSSATSSSGAATTTNATDLIFGANIVATATTGAGSGFTKRLLTSPDEDIAEDKMVTTAGSNTATAPLSSSGPWIMQMVAFRTPGAPVGSFTLSASPTSVSVAQGNQGTSTLTSTVSGGFSSAVSLTSSGAPTGTTVSFNPSTIASPGSGTSTITLTVGATTAAGTYPITVTGTGGGLQESTTVTLTVTAAPTFTLSASPTSVSVAPGSQGTSTITTTVSGGFNNAVALSASGAPTGTTVSFNPSSIPAPGSGTSTMTITVGASTAAGTYPITVTGSGGGVQQTATVTLAVAVPTFTLAASPTALNVAVGSQGTSTITTAVSGGFNNAVALSASGAPTGTTVGFNPSTIAAPGSGTSTMTVTVGSSTATGTYSITVTGNGGGVQKTATVTLTVVTASAAITYVQGNYSTPQTAQTTVTVPFTAAQTAGDLNVVVVGWNNSTSTVSGVKDSSGNTYALAVGPTAVSGTLSQSIYYAKSIASAAAGANSVTVTFSAAAAYPDVRVLEYKGADLNNPVDVTAAGSGTSTTSSSGAATTTNATDLIFGANIVTSSTSGPGSGFTQRLLTSPDGDIAEDEMVTATGSYTATAPISSGTWIMQLVAFRTPAITSGNFTLSASPTSVSVAQGSQGTPTVTTTVSGGFNSSISLSASGAPTGTTVSFNPSTIAAPGAGSSTMTIAVGASTAAGTYSITVTGNGGGVQESAIVSLTVTPAPNFTLSASPASLTVAPGNQGTSTITTAVSGGFSNSISLSASGAPSGTTVSFSPASIAAPGSGSSTMTITVGSSTPTGTYPITVAASGGGIQQTTTVTLVVATGSTTITYVQGNYSTPQTAQTTVTVPFNTAQTAGDLNVVVVGWNDTTATVSSVTDKSGNTYTLAVGPTVASGALSQSIYYAKNIVSAAAGANVVTVTFSPAAAYPDVRILEYSGADPTNPLDVTAGKSGSSTSSSSGAATTTNPTDLIFGANIVATETSGPGSGFISRLLTSPDGDIAEDEMVSTAGSYTATAPLTSSGAWIMQLVAFRTTAGGGGSGFSVSPRQSVVTFNETQQFTTSGGGGTITWSVDGVVGGSSSTGTITTGGLYTPPSTVGSHFVTATPTQGQAVSATIYVSNYAGTFTYHNDNLRSGVNSDETVLTSANVNQSLFGKLFSYSLDGIAFASPLYVANVNIPGSGYHNVVYVATENDSVYAFDADGRSSSPLWHVNFLSSGVTTVPCGDTGECGDIPNQIGITSTPLIDPSSGTIYVVAATKESSNWVQRLHALDITTGAEKFGGPVVIQASVPGTGDGASGGIVAFDSLRENQRTGLLLSNGVLYFAFGSHGDNHPWHGWVLGYNPTTLKQVMVYNASPNGYGGGIWQGGGGLATDSTGDIYFSTSNGPFDVNTGGIDYGDSIVKLTPSGTVADYFTPYDQANMSSGNLDLGAGGPVLLVDQSSGPYPHLLIAAGKTGTIYVVNRDNMGHFNPNNDDQIVQTLIGALASGGQDLGNFSTPIFFNGYVYFAAINDYLKAFQLSSGLLSTTPTSQSAEAYPCRGGSFAISANGTANGILWAVQNQGDPNNDAGAQGALIAYSATNLTNELYNTNQNASRDAFNSPAKYSIPLVANGKVFVGTQTQLIAYGLLP
jgi:uncharacterized membrane protein